MAKNCAKCVKAIRGIDFAKCGGYCDQIFHFTCCGITRPTYETVLSNSFWLCEECRAIVSNRCLKELCSADPNIQALKLELEDMKERISLLTSVIENNAADTKANLLQFGKQLTELKPNNVNNFADKSEATPRGPSVWPPINRPTPKRRREEHRISNRDIIIGTNTNRSSVVVTVPVAENKFWI